MTGHEDGGRYWRTREREDRINVGLFRVDKDEDVAVDPVDGWVYLNGGRKGVLSLESVSREELR